MLVREGEGAGDNRSGGGGGGGGVRAGEGEGVQLVQGAVRSDRAGGFGQQADGGVRGLLDSGVHHRRPRISHGPFLPHRGRFPAGGDSSKSTSSIASATPCPAFPSILRTKPRWRGLPRSLCRIISSVGLCVWWLSCLCSVFAKFAGRRAAPSFQEFKFRSPRPAHAS